MWYYGLASYSDSKYYTVWHPQQDSQRSDVVAAYTGISTHRTGSTMTTGMTITISIKVITITGNSCHIGWIGIPYTFIFPNDMHPEYVQTKRRYKEITFVTAAT